MGVVNFVKGIAPSADHYLGYVSPNFAIREFDCPCIHCSKTLIDMDLVYKLEDMRRILGTKLRINSGYRCQDYQNELRLRGFETSTGVSTHTLGQAADVSNGVSLGHELQDAAAQAGFLAIGMGSNWIHVDLRSDKVRRWGYKT